MKISELVSFLQKTQKKKGDLYIAVEDGKKLLSPAGWPYVEYDTDLKRNVLIIPEEVER